MCILIWCISLLFFPENTLYLDPKNQNIIFILHHCQPKPWLRRGERPRTSMWADQAGTVLNVQELWIDRSLTSDHYQTTTNYYLARLIIALFLPNENQQSVISENGKRSIVTTQECQTSSATSSRATQRLDWRHLCPSSNMVARRIFRYSTFCSACNSRCPLEICPTLMTDPLLNCNFSLVLPLFRPRPHVRLLATHYWLKRADSSTNR